MVDLDLTEQVEKMFSNDYKNNKQVSKCTEKEVISMIGDYDLSDRKRMAIFLKNEINFC